MPGGWRPVDVTAAASDDAAFIVEEDGCLDKGYEDEDISMEATSSMVGDELPDFQGGYGPLEEAHSIDQITVVQNSVGQNTIGQGSFVGPADDDEDAVMARTAEQSVAQPVIENAGGLPPSAPHQTGDPPSVEISRPAIEAPLSPSDSPKE